MIGTNPRIAVIGDVGGHLGALQAELARIGVPDGGTGEVPDDLVVLQVGDLIHRGPDSAGVVSLVDTHLRRTPDRWLQLIGNHEAYYIYGPQFRLEERLDRKAANTIRGWWDDGLLRAGAAFATGGGSYLATHAGLTREYWRMFLGAPETAAEAASALDDMLRRGDDRLLRTGRIHGGAVDFAAGPLWAASDVELVASWRGHGVPFSQVHGHSSPVRWPAGTPVGDVALEEVSIDHVLRHTTIHLRGREFIGVDPAHGEQAAESWGAWQRPLDRRG